MGSILDNEEHPCRPLTVGAVLLAAGAGSRIGHRPKCLLEFDGEPLIRRQLSALSEAGVDEVVVVLGHYAPAIEALIQSCRIKRVRNPDPDAGQNASLHIGLAALSDGPDAILVALADQPLIQAPDIAALISAYNKRPTGMELVQPTVEALPGNPVMFSNSVRQQILAGPAHFGGRQWQAKHPDKVYRWPTSNPNYRTDIDSREDIEALARRTGQQLVWPAGLADVLGVAPSDPSDPPGPDGSAGLAGASQP